MVKRKQDGTAEPQAKRQLTDKRIELDLDLTQYVAAELKKKPCKRLSLPCPMHDRRCSCKKQRIKVDMYAPGDSFFGLFNTCTGLPFMPTGQSGDNELEKVATEKFVENPTLMEKKRFCLAGIVEKVLLQQFDIINPGARVERILDAAMETARKRIPEKPATMTQQQHGELKDSMIAAAGLFHKIGGIVEQHQARLDQQEGQYGELKE